MWSALNEALLHRGPPNSHDISDQYSQDVALFFKAKTKDIDGLCTQVIITVKNLHFELKIESLIGRWLLVFLQCLLPNHTLKLYMRCSSYLGGHKRPSTLSL